MALSLPQLSSLVKQLTPPSQSVKAWLRNLPKPTGVQVFDQLRRAIAFLKEGIASGPHPDTTKLLVFSLRDIHALVLELDDDVTDALSADDGPQYRDEVTAERCRAWLQQLQTFVVAVQKDLELLLASGSSSSGGGGSSSSTIFQQRPLGGSSTISSPAMSSLSLSGHSSAAGSCSASEADVEMADVSDAHSVRHGQWDVLLRHTLDSLALALADDSGLLTLQQQGLGLGLDLQGMVCDDTAGSAKHAGAKLSKLVCRRSALSYRDFWASKPTL